MYNQNTYKASMKYDAVNTRQIKMKLNLKTDADILARLDSVPNKQGYIKALIRKDMYEHMSIGEAFLRRMSDEQLLHVWEETEQITDENVYTLRGWLMNEIERRYPKQYNDWLDSEALDCTLRIYILGGNKNE